MKSINKKAILHEHRELAEEVLDIYSLKVFIILDLLLFSIFFGILLHPILTSLWLNFFYLFFFSQHLLSFFNYLIFSKEKADIILMSAFIIECLTVFFNPFFFLKMKYDRSAENNENKGKEDSMRNFNPCNSNKHFYSNEPY